MADLHDVAVILLLQFLIASGLIVNFISFYLVLNMANSYCYDVFSDWGFENIQINFD